MSGGVVSLVDLPVHIGPHAPDVKAALLQCTEAQVAEFYRAWSSTDVGKTAIHNIVSTTKEFGPSQNALATSFGSPVKNMLMSPSRGSPMSPNGRLHAGAFSPPLSPSAGRASLLSPSRRSATSIDAASPRQFSLTPAGADESYPSAETIAAATSPVGYSPRTAAINAAFGFGAVGAVAHGHVPFSPTGGATGKLRIGQPGAGAGSSTSAGVTGAGASPSSPMSPSSHNGAGGSNSSSSPGIAIRVSPSSAAASAGGAGGSSGISLRLGATSMGNRSHSAEGALAGSSGGNGSPIRSPAVTYSGFSAEMDGPGFSPTRSIGSFALSSALAAAGGSGGPALPISPRIMRSISAPPLGAPAGAAGGSMVMPTLGSAGLGGGASEGAAGSPSGTGVQSAVSSPASSPSMSSANSPVASPVPFAATSSISISAPASFSAAASSSLPPRSPREVSPSSLTAAAAGAASSSPASSFSASLAAAAAEGKTGDHHAAEEGKGDDHHHAAVASVSITTTDASGAAATAVTAAAADSSVRDLASTLAAVTISTGSSATAPSATEEAKANDVAAASSAASAAALVEPATAASSSSQQPLSGLTSSQANSVASSSSAKAAAAAAASKPQQPGIPTFYSREQGGAISLGLKRKPASQPPAPIIPAPVAPKVSNGQPPQPVPGRGKPLRSMPGQTLPEMLPLMIDLFTKHNCAGRAPDHPYAKVNAASEKHNATVIANNNSSRGKGKDAGKKGAAAAGGGRGRASSIGSSKGVVGGGRTGSSGSLTRTKSGKSLTSSANNSDAENDSDDDGASQQPPLRPIVNVQVRVAGCSVSWEDAHRAVSVDHFAAVTKPICGFPSFFAAPLFRRLKSTYLGNTNNSNGGRNHREGVPIVPADWNAEAAAMAANVGVLITAASKSNSSGSGSGSSVEQEGNALAGAHASAASAAGGNGLATSRSSAGPHSNRPRSGSSVTNGNLSPSANGAAGAGGAAVVDRVLEVEVRANPPSQVREDDSLLVCVRMWCDACPGCDAACCACFLIASHTHPRQSVLITLTIDHQCPHPLVCFSTLQDDASSRDTSGMISLPVFMQYWREEMEGYDHVSACVCVSINGAVHPIPACGFVALRNCFTPIRQSNRCIQPTHTRSTKMG